MLNKRKQLKRCHEEVWLLKEIYAESRQVAERAQQRKGKDSQDDNTEVGVSLTTGFDRHSRGTSRHSRRRRETHVYIRSPQGQDSSQQAHRGVSHRFDRPTRPADTSKRANRRRGQQQGNQILRRRRQEHQANTANGCPTRPKGHSGTV